MLTASALFEPPDASGQSAIGDNAGLFTSSLALSLLSMAYGIFVACCQMEDSLGDTNTPKKTTGKQGQLFVCILISVTWSIMAMGFAYGSQDLGAARYVFPLCMFFLVFVVIFISGLTLLLGLSEKNLLEASRRTAARRRAASSLPTSSLGSVSTFVSV